MCILMFKNQVNCAKRKKEKTTVVIIFLQMNPIVRQVQMVEKHPNYITNGPSFFSLYKSNA